MSMRAIIDGEIQTTCKDCGNPSIIRELGVASETNGRRVSYETHARCISDTDHAAALDRLKRFYEQVLGLIDEFKALPEKARIVRAGKAAGLLIELDIGTERPTACAVRTNLIPAFTLKSFGAEYPVNLPSRELAGVTLADLLSEAEKQAKPIIEDIAERKAMGL